MCARDLKQFLNSLFEFFALDVIGIRTEGRVLPGSVLRVGTGPPPATQLRVMEVKNSYSVEVGREFRFVEVRISTGAWEASHVN
jgi:hypothetical protein